MLLVLSQLAEAIVIDDKDYKAEFVTNTVDANGCTPTEVGGVITIKEDTSQMLDDEDRIHAFERVQMATGHSGCQSECKMGSNSTQFSAIKDTLNLSLISRA